MKTSVVTLTNQTITIKNENLDKNIELKFDYLVLATGSSYGFPIKTPYSDYKDVVNNFKNINKSVEDSKNILIVGAGATGTYIHICNTVYVILVDLIVYRL